MAARNQDFVVKNGLQVTSNLVVGTYTGTATSQIANGAIISGNVGIGTSTVPQGSRLDVAGGNITINTVGYGLVFPDGSYQYEAAQSYGPQYTLQFAGVNNTFSGDGTNLYWDAAGTRLNTSNLTINSSLDANSPGSGALIVTGGASVGGNLYVAGTINITGNINVANVSGVQDLTVNSLVSNTFVRAGGQVSGQSMLSSSSITAASYVQANQIIANVNVGIGTATVQYPLDIYGNIHIGNTASTSSGILFPDGTFQNTAAFYTPSYGPPGTIQFAGNDNTFSGDASNFAWYAGNTTLQVNGGLVSLNNATANLIDFGINGVDYPSYGPGSAGTKINLYNDGVDIPYSLGIDPTPAMSFTIPSGAFYNYYGGGCVIAQLDSVGNWNNTGTAQISGCVTISGGTITLNNYFGNYIDFGINGYAPPSFSTRSVGSKLVLSDQIDGSHTDFAIGMDNAVLWTGVPQNNSTYSFAWYGGITPVMTLDGTGVLTVANSISTPSFSVTGNISAGNVNVIHSQSIGNNLVIGGNLTVAGNFQFGNVGVAQDITVNSLTSNTFVQAAGVGRFGRIVANANAAIGTITVTGSNVLSVLGTANYMGNIYITNTATTSGITFSDGTYQATAAANTPSFGAPGTIQFAGNSNLFTGNTSAFFWDNGNVRLGIGTNLPAQTLTVSGNILLTYGNVHQIYGRVGIGTSNIKIGDNLLVYGGNINVATFGTGIYFPDGSFQKTSAGTSAAGPDKSVQFNDAGAFAGQNNFAFDKINARLGIGTSMLNNSLGVYGGSPALFNTTNGADQQIIVGNAASDGAVVGFNSGATTAYGYLQYAGSVLTNIAFTKTGTGIGGITVPVNTLDIGGGIAIGSAYAGVQTAPSDGLIAVGRVGIGTFAPGSALDVATNASIRGRFSVAGEADIGGLVVNTSIAVSSLNISGLLQAGSMISNTTIQVDGAAYVNSLISNTTIQSIGIATLNEIVANTNTTTNTLNARGLATVNDFISNTNVTSDTVNTKTLARVAALISNNNISGATINVSGLAQLNSLVSNTTIQSIGTATVNSLISNNNITGATLNTTGVALVNSLVSNTNVYGAALQTSGNATVGNLISNGTITTNGTGGNIIGVNTIYAVSLQGSGQTTVNSLVANANIYGASINIAGVAYLNSLISNNNVFGATLQSSGQATVNSLVSNTSISAATMTLTGTFTAGNVYSNGFTQTAGLTTTNQLIANANISGANINIAGPAQLNSLISNTTAQISGTATVNALISNNNVFGATLNTSGLAQVNSFISNTTAQVSGTATVNALIANTNVFGATLNTSGLAQVNSLIANNNITGATVNSTGLAQVSSLISNNNTTTNTLNSTGAAVVNSLNSNTFIQAAGAATVNSLLANANITGANLNISGTAWQGNVYSNGIIQSTGLATVNQLIANANVYGANLNIAGLAQVNSLNVNTATSTASLNVGAGGAIVGSLISNTNTTTATFNATGAAEVNSLIANTTIQGLGTATVNALYSNTFIQANGNLTVGGVNSNGTIVGTQIWSNSTIQAAGTATVNALISNNNVFGATIVSNGTAQFGNVTSNGYTTTANLNVTGNAQIANLTVNSSISTGTITSKGAAIFANITSNGAIQAAGEVTVNDLISNNNVFGATLQSSGQALVGSLSSNSTIQSAGAAVVNGLTSNTTISITSGGLQAFGNSKITGNLQVTGNLTLGGNSTTITVQSLSITNPTVQLGIGTGGTPLVVDDGFDRGLFMDYYKDPPFNGELAGFNHAFLGWQDSTDRLIFLTNVAPGILNVTDQNADSYPGVIYGGAVFGNIWLSNAQSISTNTTSGGVVTIGGIGVGGNINVGGQVSNFSGNVNISGSNTATSATTGALTVAAGAGILGNLYVGGNLVANNGAQFSYVVASNAITAASIFSNGIIQTASALVAASIDSNGTITGSNFFSNGAVQASGNVTAGGLNANGTIVGSQIWSNSTIQAAGNITVGGVNSNGSIVASQITSNSTIQAAGNVFVNALYGNGIIQTVGTVVAAAINSNGVIVGNGIYSNSFVQGGAFTAASVNSNGNIVGATITSNGAVQAAGTVTAAAINSNGTIVGNGITSNGAMQSAGVAVHANIISNANIQAATTVTANGIISNVYGAFGQNVTIGSSNTSTSTSTGALVVTGGVGIGGNINVGGTRNLFTNSVGIGTSTPTGLSNVFAVYGSENLSGNLVISNTAAGGSGIYFPDGTFLQTAATVAGVNESVQFNDNGKLGGTANFLFDKVNTRLGVGTTAAGLTNSFMVYGSTPAIFNTTNGADQQIEIGNGTTDGATLGFASGAGTAYGYLKYTGAASSMISFNKTGVGISGVTIPQNPLEVNGTTVIGSSWVGNNSFVNPPSNGLAVQGSVGVGTYTPLSTLDVRGVGSFSTALSTGGTASVSALIANNNVFGATLNTSGLAQVANLVSNGYITGASITVSGAGLFNSIISNTTIQSAGTATVNALIANNNVFGATLNTSGLAQLNSLIANNNITTSTLNSTGAAEVNSLIANTTVQAIGTATVNALIANNNVYGATLNTSGLAQLNSIVSNNNTTTSTLITTGQAQVNSLIANANIQGANLNITSTAFLGNIYSNGFVQAAGTVTVNALIGNNNVYGGTLQTSGLATVNALISNTYITAANINITSSLVATSITANTYVQAGSYVLGNSLISNVYGVFGQNVTVNSSNASTASNNGALVVVGGAGINGNVNIGGQLNLISGNLLLSGTNVSVSSTTGALVVTNGVGIGGALNTAGQIATTQGLNVGATAIVNALISNTNITTASLNDSGTAQVNSLISNTTIQGIGTATFNNIYSNGFVQAAGTVTAAAINSNGVIVGNGIYSNSFVQGGAFTAASLNSNGAIVGANIYSNGFVQAAGTATVNALISNVYGVFGQNVTINSTNAASATSASTGALVVAGGAGIASGLTTTGFVNLIGSGALEYTVRIKGSSTGDQFAIATNGTAGYGVANDALNAAGTAYSAYALSASTVTIKTGAAVPAAALSINPYGNSVFAQNLSVSSSNASTSTATGALVITGGAGIGGNINVGGTYNLFANNVGIGTSTVLGVSNVFAVYGNENLYGNLVIQKGQGSTAGIYFADGSYLLTAGGGGSYSNTNVASYLSGPVSIGNLSITNATASTSSSSGALQMFGGAGIQGNLNVGANTWSTFGGNVGIGTANAFGVSNVMAVYGSANHYGNIVLSKTATSSNVGIYFPDGTYQYTASMGGGGGGGSPGGSNTQIQYNLNGSFAGSGGLVFFGNTNSMGIGTSSPAYNLDVYGNIHIGNNATGGSNGIVFADGTIQTSAPNAAVQTFTFTATAGQNTFSVYPYSPTAQGVNLTQVFVNGVYQRTSTYAWTGTNIVLTVGAVQYARVEIRITVPATSLTNVGSKIAGSNVFNVQTAGVTVWNTGFTYTVGYLDVYLNGIKLTLGQDYTAGTGTSVTFAASPPVNSIVQMTGWNTNGVQQIQGNNVFNVQTSGVTVWNTGFTYTVGYLDVYVNGVKLASGYDYTATTGTSVQFTNAPTKNSLVEFEGWTQGSTLGQLATQRKALYVASAGQTVFASQGPYVPPYVDVYVNGIKLVYTTDYTATDGATVVLTSGLLAGSNVEVISSMTFAIGDVIRRTGDIFTGNVGIGTSANSNAFVVVGTSQFYGPSSFYGNINTTGSLVTGGGLNLGGNLAVTGTASISSNLSIGGTLFFPDGSTQNTSSQNQLQVLNDISTAFDGQTTTFNLYIGTSNINIATPQQLLVSVGGAVLAPFITNPDYIDLSEVTLFTRGYKLNNGHTIVFANAPRWQQDFSGRVLSNTAPVNNTVTYPFKPLNIALADG